MMLCALVGWGVRVGVAFPTGEDETGVTEGEDGKNAVCGVAVAAGRDVAVEVGVIGGGAIAVDITVGDNIGVAVSVAVDVGVAVGVGVGSRRFTIKLVSCTLPATSLARRINA
jgi:hypothetical protein